MLYIAEKAGKPIPSDFQGRVRVTQWCFATLNTVEPPLALIALGDVAGMTDQERALWIKLANRVFRRAGAPPRRPRIDRPRGI
ncbi:MAG: hypothetical protein K2Y27_11885 [Xanthobacteraceae bacterium]|nr:hypothetical protein [Xanthobacteraceae bacterium]